MIELGISTFGETTEIEGTWITPTHDERIRELVEEMKLADEVGLDIYSIGEHHRKDFAVSSPEIVLAAGAAVTKNIRLSSAVTVLSSADPIRVYQQYATIDAISNGRSEIMVGRGSFTESFPLFGYSLANYEELFDEKLAMLENIKEHEILEWKGKFTQTVKQKGVYPRAVQEDFPIWVATGGNTESTVKIAQKGLPIAYAIIGGKYENFKGLSSVSPEGAMLVGSPDTVAKKLIKMIEMLGLDRFMLHLPLGSMQHEDILKAIELFGREVAPKVRAYFENK